MYYNYDKEKSQILRCSQNHSNYLPDPFAILFIYKTPFFKKLTAFFKIILRKRTYNKIKRYERSVKLRAAQPFRRRYGYKYFCP